MPHFTGRTVIGKERGLFIGPYNGNRKEHQGKLVVYIGIGSWDKKQTDTTVVVDADDLMILLGQAIEEQKKKAK